MSLRENFGKKQKKYKTFSIPTEKEVTKIDKDNYILQNKTY